jgi:hypothetical protein
LGLNALIGLVKCNATPGGPAAANPTDAGVTMTVTVRSAEDRADRDRGFKDALRGLIAAHFRLCYVKGCSRVAYRTDFSREADLPARRPICRMHG